MNNGPITLHGDQYHGLVYGNNSTYNVGVDGPYLFGYSGGALGTSGTSFNNISLGWNYTAITAYKPLNMNGNNIYAGSNQLLSIGTNTTPYPNVIDFSNYGGSLGDIKMRSYNIQIGDDEGGTVSLRSGGGGYAIIEAGNIHLEGTVNMCNNAISNCSTLVVTGGPFTENFSNSNVSSGGWLYFPTVSQSGWSYTQLAGITYGATTWNAGVSPITAIPLSLGYNAYIQSQNGLTSSLYRTLVAPAGVPLTLSFWYTSRGTFTTMTFTVSYGSQTIATITNFTSQPPWTSLSYTFTPTLANQALTFSALGPNGTDQSIDIAYVQVVTTAATLGGTLDMCNNGVINVSRIDGVGNPFLLNATGDMNQLCSGGNLYMHTDSGHYIGLYQASSYIQIDPSNNINLVAPSVTLNGTLAMGTAWTGGSTNTLWGDSNGGGKYIRWAYNNNPGTTIHDNSNINLATPYVGINCNTPVSTFDVNGTGRFSSNLILYNTSTSPRFQMYGQGATTFVGIDLYPYYGSLGGKLNFRDASYGSTMEFSNGNGGPSPTLYERFRIDTNGYVGINNSAPVGQLHVKTSSGTPAYTGWDSKWMIVTSASNSSTPGYTPALGLGYSVASNAAYIAALEPFTSWKDLEIAGLSIRLVANAGGTHSFSVYTSGGTLLNSMTLTSNGLGIGITTPQYILDVNTTSNTAIRIGPRQYVGTAADTTTYGLERSRHEIRFAGYRDAQIDKISSKIVNINKQTYGASSYRHLIQSADLAFFTVPPNTNDIDNTVERLRITDTGTVGINTTTPVTTLDVNGGLTVRNGIRPLYQQVTSGTSITPASYGTHYDIQTSAITGLTVSYPASGSDSWSNDSNAYWIFRNNTGSYLSLAVTYTAATPNIYPSNITIPPGTSTTLMATYPGGGTNSNYVLF